MALIYLSLGSNIERQRRINAALDALADCFGELTVSSVYESESVGFAGDSFYNLVVGINTEMPVGEVSKVLKAIEDENGRDRSAPKFGARTLDIDILTVDDLDAEIDGIKLPRDEVLKNAFVLLPLAEIAPDSNHPVTGQTYAHHWAAYNKNKQKLWPVTFIWREKDLTGSN
ncbi:MAG: 2-amino-4-hydroxy-6-hydroxymethyldihydropteridine diphosphokinase [Porticoccaceae bacterium]|nr:2-amino-4-hydroxy-6-hydroxymethyldihydropteridine diphosphokinase [Porticoccaceae bacterium]